MNTTLDIHEHDLTPEDLLVYYREAYEKLHSQSPSCEYLEKNHFVINGTPRDWHWLALEIELLHQRLLTTAMNGESADYHMIRKMVRRFQYAIRETN